MLRNPSEHFRANLFIVVEREYVGRAVRMAQFRMRASLRNNGPANSLQGAEYRSCFGARPMAQADFSRILIDVGMSLEASTSSAIA